jgi:hypothetical protein
MKLVAVVAVLLTAEGHPNPPNLADVDCAVYEFAVAYGVSKFSSDPSIQTALSAALLIPANCNVTLATKFEDRLGGYSRRHSMRPDTLIFVDASKGDDRSGDGTLSKPFATIERARDQIRKTPVGSRLKTTVNLRAGTYYLTTTFELTAEDSGTSAAAPITYTAYNNEAVTISGGMPLKLDWEPYHGTASTPITAGTAFKARLPDGVAANFTTLFVDNKRQIRSRFPNGNPADVSGMCFSKTQYPNEGCNGYLGGLKQVNAVPLSQDISFVAAMPGYNDTRDGLYPRFDGQAGGFCGLFSGPAGKCVPKSIADSLRAASEAGGHTTLNCTPSTPCTVPCSTPGSLSWCAHYDRIRGVPQTVQYDSSSWTKKVWNSTKVAKTGVFRSFVGMGWGSQSFPITGFNASSRQITFGPGGWQIGDSSGASKHFYVEGVLEELVSGDTRGAGE